MLPECDRIASWSANMGWALRTHRECLSLPPQIDPLQGYWTLDNFGYTVLLRG
jgi:hypothetical protein